MPGEDDLLVSRADIARLAEVHRPAVANWERRHADFPEPVTSVEGVEQFRAVEVVAWLQNRLIPRNARRGDEAAGTSYADRFRRNLGTRTILAPANLAETLVDALYRRIGTVRRANEVEYHRDLLLVLIWLRACHPGDWLRLAEVSYLGVHAFVEELRSVLRAIDHTAQPAVPDAGQLPETSHIDVAELMRLIDAESVRAGVAEAEMLRLAFAGLVERYAEREGKWIPDLFTPPSITRLAAGLLARTGGGRSVYDPYCRSGEFLAAVIEQSVASGCPSSELTVEGWSHQASSCWIAGARLELHAVRGSIRHGLGLADVNPGRIGHDLVVCNPPFNLRLDKQVLWHHPWRYGDPPPHNSNFAWLQHALAALNDQGRAAVLLPNGALFSTRPRERAIRAEMIEDGVVACLVALPARLFPAVAVSVTLWVLDRQRRRPDEILLVDATSVGNLTTRTRRVLTENDLSQVVETFSRWWAGGLAASSEAIPARSVPLAEIRSRDYHLNPAAYLTGAPDEPSADVQPEGFAALAAEFHRLRAAASEVEAKVEALSEAVQVRRVGPAVLSRTSTLLGDVPGDWREVPLGQLAQIHSGLNFRRDFTTGAGVPVVLPRDLRDGWVTDEPASRLPSHSREMVERYGLLPGDILCVRTGELGGRALVGPDQSGWLFGSGLFRIRPAREAAVSEFLAHYLGLPQVRAWIRRNDSGTAVPTIQARVLEGLPIVLPEFGVQRDIGAALELVQDELRTQERLARITARLRDTLGPLLITGRLAPP
ncbi:N-6 DNA methylase [Micromonospora echinospora]